MLNEIAELNIKACVECTDAMKGFLEESEEKLVHAFGANAQLLEVIRTARAMYEYYHNAPESPNELYKFIRQQEQLIQCCNEMSAEAERFNALCSKFVKLSKDFRARAGVAA